MMRRLCHLQTADAAAAELLIFTTSCHPFSLTAVSSKHWLKCVGILFCPAALSSLFLIGSPIIRNRFRAADSRQFLASLLIAGPRINFESASAVACSFMSCSTSRFRQILRAPCLHAVGFSAAAELGFRDAWCIFRRCCHAGASWFSVSTCSGKPGVTISVPRCRASAIYVSCTHRNTSGIPPEQLQNTSGTPPAHL